MVRMGIHGYHQRIIFITNTISFIFNIRQLINIEFVFVCYAGLGLRNFVVQLFLATPVGQFLFSRDRFLARRRYGYLHGSGLRRFGQRLARIVEYL